MAEGKINANLRISDGTNDYKTLKELCKRGACTAYMTGRGPFTVTSWDTYYIPLRTLSINDNTKFEGTATGGVKILKDMEVLISAQMCNWGCPDTSDETDINIKLNRNGTETNCGKAFSWTGRTSACHDHHVTPFYMDLKAGDILYLTFLSSVGGSWRVLGDDMCTYLTIQEL